MAATKPRFCEHCGAALPESQYCVRCGVNITPFHSCGPAFIPSIPHTCVVALIEMSLAGQYSSPRCEQCGRPLPKRCYCADCGAEVTPIHDCKAAGGDRPRHPALREDATRMRNRN